MKISPATPKDFCQSVQIGEDDQCEIVVPKKSSFKLTPNYESRPLPPFRFELPNFSPSKKSFDPRILLPVSYDKVIDSLTNRLGEQFTIEPDVLIAGLGVAIDIQLGKEIKIPLAIGAVGEYIKGIPQLNSTNRMNVDRLSIGGRAVFTFNSQWAKGLNHKASSICSRWPNNLYISIGYFVGYEKLKVEFEYGAETTEFYNNEGFTHYPVVGIGMQIN